jgi:hypothetical protein
LAAFIAIVSGKSKAREFLLMNQDDLARDCLLLGVALG